MKKKLSMKKDPKIFIEHILESIKDIEDHTKGFPKEKFLLDKKTQDATVRRITIIGEAVKHLPLALKNDYPQIPWKKIAGTRDILIHEYFGVDLDLLWQITQKEIKQLKKQIKEILKYL